MLNISLSNYKTYINRGVYILYGINNEIFKAKIITINIQISNNKQQIKSIGLLLNKSKTIFFKNIDELFLTKKEANEYRIKLNDDLIKKFLFYNEKFNYYKNILSKFIQFQLNEETKNILIDKYNIDQNLLNDEKYNNNK